MNNLKLEGTAKTPTINFNTNGELLIKGRSIPENSVEFYKPVIDWLSEYNNSAQAETKVKVQLEYFNTSSSKCILDVFKKLEALENTNLSIAWYYEEDDEDMLEAGEDYMAIISIEFEMIEVEEL
jgi:hypothetical protein